MSNTRKMSHRRHVYRAKYFSSIPKIYVTKYGIKQSQYIKYYSSKILFLNSCIWVIKTLGPSLQRGKLKGPNLRVVTSPNRLVYIVRLIFIFPESKRTKIQKRNKRFLWGYVMFKSPSNGQRHGWTLAPSVGPTSWRK